MRQERQEHAGPPPSVTNSYLSLAGLLSAVGGLLLAAWTEADPLWVTAVCLALVSAPVILGDLLLLQVHRRPSAGLRGPHDGLNAPDLRRVSVKLLGLCAALAAAALFYWLMPLYRSAFYRPFLDLAAATLPLLLILAVPYFAWLDRRQLAPEDGYWEAGQACLGRWRRRNLNELREFALGWVIKIFFLPLMVGGFYKVIVWLTARPFGGGFEDVFNSVRWFSQLALFGDLAFVTVGYILTLRVLDSHIRSVNPLVIGWVVALICYQPFWSVIGDQYLGYGDGFIWSHWLDGQESVAWIWGAAMLAANACWVWANMTFGTRFSNLTHRGILTNGPYRYTKHPSYIAKCVFWWLLGVPFVSALGWDEALRNCFLFLLIGAIYLARARTEERHLSQDPTYVAYALWIEQHGLFRWVGKLVPALAYRPPASFAPAASRAT